MKILNERHFETLHLNLYKSGNHGKEWQKLYNFPSVGLSMIYSPLSSPKYLGKSLGVTPYISFPIVKTNHFSSNFLVGAGLGYVTKKFDRIDNHKNLAVGSHLNGIMTGGFDFRYSFNSSFEITSGISLIHFSSGKINVPNLGINTLSIYTGIAYNVQRRSCNIIYEDEMVLAGETQKAKEKKSEYNIFAGGGLKQLYPPGGPSYFAGTLSFNYKYLFSKKRKIGVGADLFYDYSYKVHFERRGHEQNDIAYLKPGIYLLHDFRLGDFAIITNIGTYLYAYGKNKGIGLLYKRAGLQYFFSQKISAQIALKTHYAKADFIEFSINYSL